MTRLWMAQLVNRLHGGAVVAAWEVDELDEFWQALFVGLSRMGVRQKRYQAIQRVHDQFRQDYNKRFMNN